MQRCSIRLSYLLALLTGLVTLNGCDNDSSGNSRLVAPEGTAFCDASDAPVINDIDRSAAPQFGISAHFKDL